MKHKDYIAERMDRDPEFKRLWEEGRPLFEFRSGMISARIDAGMSQSQLAEATGITRSMISRIEDGISEPKLDIMVRLAKTLGLSILIGPDRSVSIERSDIVAAQEPHARESAYARAK